jgi:hypothetical protein
MVPENSDWNSILLLVEWIRQHYVQDSDLLHLAILICKSFKAKNSGESIDLDLEKRPIDVLEGTKSLDILLEEIRTFRSIERCPMCAKSIILQNHMKALCPDNHIWGKSKDRIVQIEF